VKKKNVSGFRGRFLVGDLEAIFGFLVSGLVVSPRFTWRFDVTMNNEFEVARDQSVALSW
jgi:hypothetical protein